MIDQEHYTWGMGCVATGLGAPLLGGACFVAGLLMGNWGMAFLTGFLGFSAAIAAGIIWTLKAAKRNKYIPSQTELKLREVAEIVGRFKTLDKDHQLIASLDPTAMEFLEAGAYHWTRVSQALEGPYFSSSRLAGHWVAMRDEAKRSADEAMADLLLLAFRCMGEPPRTRNEDLRELVVDLQRGDLREVLQGFKTVVDKDWRDYAHRSPNMAGLYEPASEICQSLKSLADQLEPMAHEKVEAEIGGTTESHRTSSASSIELLLSEMRAVRQAEEELTNEQKS
jgi:hypothetical protein